MRTIKIAALNIAMHQPHSADRYVSMMQDAYRLRHLVRLGNLHGAMLGSLYAEKTAGGVRELTGEIYRFVNLDPSEPWFNTRTTELATEADVQEISIPKYLLPHLQRLPFLFRPKVHQLLFVSRDRGDRMGPQTATKFFQSLFDHLRNKVDYPPIDVTAMVDQENLNEMLSLPTLEKLTIELKRPNPDDAGSEHAKWMRKLERQNVQKQITQLVAEKGSSILPDEDTRSFAQVAANNGNVKVLGRDAGGTRVDESTSARPMLITEHVDANIETTMQVLGRTEI